MAEPTERTKPTTHRDVRSVVETANAEDENTRKNGGAASEDDDEGEDEDDEDEEDEDDDAGSDEEDDDEEEESDDDDESEEEDSEEEDDKPTKKSKSEKKSAAGFRYTQYAGDGTEKSYRKNLEEAYKNSSAEGVRLAQENQLQARRMQNLVAAAKSDPEFAEKLNAILSEGGTTAGAGGDAGTAKTPGAAQNPFLANAESEWKRKSEKEAQEFIDANPEVLSDPQINAKVRKRMETISRIEWEENERLITAGEAMEEAYRQLGYADKRGKNKVINGAKKSVSPTRPAGTKKKPKTASDFTEGQLVFAAEMGVSKEKLAKYAK